MPRTKPTHIKLVTGNPGKRKLPEDEPAPEVGIPDPPKWLLKGWQPVWKETIDELSHLGVVTLADRAAIGLLVNARIEYIRAKKVVEKCGEYYETETPQGDVVIRKHPAVVQMDICDKKIRMKLGDFGLTPSSRPHVKAPKAPTKNRFAK